MSDKEKLFYKEEQNWPYDPECNPAKPALLGYFSDRHKMTSARITLRGYGIPVIDGSLMESVVQTVYFGSGFQTGALYVPEELLEDASELISPDNEPDFIDK